MEAYLSARRFKIIIVTICLFNIFFLAGTWYYHVAGNRAGGVTGFLSLQLSLAFENVFAAWYSSMILLLVAVMCFLCFVADRKRFIGKAANYLNFGWVILTLIFMTLSLDELGSFHETIGDTEIFEMFGKSNGWLVFNFLIIFVGVFMFLFCWIRLRRVPSAAIFMTLAVLMLLSNPLQENFEIESMQNAPDPLLWRRPVIFLLLEEGSEIFATLFFLIATMLYYLRAMRQSTKVREASTEKNFFIQHKASYYKAAFAVLILLGIAFLIIDLYVERQGGNAIGIPKNWFPAALGWIIFLVCTYKYFNALKHERLIYVWIATLAIISSVYFGSDLYEHNFNEMKKAEVVFEVAFIAATSYAGVKIFVKQKGFLNRAIILIWVILTGLSITSNETYAAEVSFVGFSFLVFSLINLISTTDSRNAKSPAY